MFGDTDQARIVRSPMTHTYQKLRIQESTMNNTKGSQMLSKLPFCMTLLIGIAILCPNAALAEKKDIVHDAEYYILEAQHGGEWAAEDKELDAKLAALRKKHGTPPNIVYVLWDDVALWRHWHTRHPKGSWF